MASPSDFQTDFGLDRPVEFYAHDPKTGALTKFSHGSSYVSAVLGLADAERDPNAAVEVPDLLFLLALIRAYWYIFAQNLVHRTLLLAMPPNRLKPPPCFEETITQGTYFLSADTAPARLALLIVREAMLRWTGGTWLVRPPQQQAS